MSLAMAAGASVGRGLVERLAKNARTIASSGIALKALDLNYFRAGGKSVQLPCATSAAMPMLSPSVGCG